VVYAVSQSFFSHNIVTLLSGLTEDISFALDNFERENRRRHAESQMVLATRVYDNSNEGIIITDADREIISVNRSFTIITQYDQNEVIGKMAHILSHDKYEPDFYKDMMEKIDQIGSWQGEVLDRRKDNSPYPQWLSVIAVKDDLGVLINYICIFTDISERKQNEERIQNLAHFDVLTGLPNRILFKDRVEQALIKAQRKHDKVAILFLDLDRFKQINDSLGHRVGDFVLKEIAERLLSCVREQDTVSRQGGDEFILILPETDAQGAAKVAENILQVASKRCQIEGFDLHITPSIGISVYPDDSIDSDTLIKYADVAMYQAKENGRNTYKFYTSDMNAKVYERMTIENGLRQALENQNFVLYYQPQISLKDDRIVGCEALIRWNHAEKGLISPAHFIPVAEETGLIVPIGDWVMHEACRQALVWKKAGLPPITMAVNLSAIQFSHTSMSNQIIKMLEDIGLSPEHFELELTESILMGGVDTTLATLNNLAEFGLKLSIDDFGTGYSSLSYLKRFPLHRLKIDQSFVRDITHDANDAAIVKTIIGMAKSLNLEVIAEGVETQEQAEFLQRAGCDEIQGYYFSPPVPASEFATMLHVQVSMDELAARGDEKFVEHS
jgi:diguanylate cyclase (GGDEF)-like protein/PAS domain S-box-containing protein